MFPAGLNVTPLRISKTRVKADVNYQNTINWPPFLLKLVNYYCLVMVLLYLDLSLSTSIETSCIILLNSALFKCCMKSFALSEAQGKPLTTADKEFTRFVSAGLLLNV